jgi:hypothetical protein
LTAGFPAFTGRFFKQTKLQNAESACRDIITLNSIAYNPFKKYRLVVIRGLNKKT